MLIFFENLTRYPKFLITSVIGLIIVITRPFTQLIKGQSNQPFILLIFFGIILTSIVLILKTMLDY